MTQAADIPNPHGRSPRGSSSMKDKAAKKIEMLDRRRRVAALSLARKTLPEIQEDLAQVGILAAIRTLKRDLQLAKQLWREENRVAIAAAQEQELAALAKDEARLRGFLVKLEPSKHKERVAYQETILKVMQLRAKILGTEAPTKVDVTAVAVAPPIALEGDPVLEQLVRDAAARIAAPPPLELVISPAPPSNGTNGNGHAHA